MPSPLTAPALAVVADVVRQLEGDDALPLLWTLFTKCKESLKDGHRLENISWRLWYKLAVSNPLPSHSLFVPYLAAVDFVLNEKAYRPSTPEEIPQPTPVTCRKMSNAPSSTQGVPEHINSSPLSQQNGKIMSLSPATSLSSSLSRNSSSRRNSQRRSSTHVSVGKVLCELLPSATVPSLSSLTPVPNAVPTLSSFVFSPTQPGDPRTLPSISLPLSSPLAHLTAILPPMTLTIKPQAPPPASLPTPEVEHFERDGSLLSAVRTISNVNDSSAIVPVITTDDSSPLENCNQLASAHHDPPPTLPPPPRLVVVNPTPNPTPHPTPPATPVLHPPVMRTDSEATSTLLVPLLRVPGHDALVQSQLRARGTQPGSKLRLIARDPEEEDKRPTSPVDLEPNPAEATPRSEAPSAIPAPPSEASECAINPNRQSISSDTTTTSSSQRSSSSNASHYSQTTSVTTVSEYPFLEMRFSSSPEPQHPVDKLASGLSPTYPSYTSNSVLAQTSLSFPDKKRYDKDAASETPAAHCKASSASAKSTSTSKGPDSQSLTSKNKESPSLIRPVNHPARKTSSGGVSTTTGTGLSRIKREGSTTSAKTSRSRSRTREGSSTALSALGMMRANSGKGSGGVGKAGRGRPGVAGRTAGMRGKTLSKKPSMHEYVEESKRSTLFNIGSGSDAGSKSTGSGSEMNTKQGNAAPPSSLSNTGPVVEETSVDTVSKEMIPNLSVAPAEEKVQSPRRNQPKVKEKEAGVVVDKEKIKGKGKEKAKSPKTSTLPKYVQETIADPLLPSKGRQVVLTSDSEEDDFETETESWTGTESADAPVSASQRRLQHELQQQLEQQKQIQLQQQEEQRQAQLLQQLQQQRQQAQQPQARPHAPPLMRTQSHNISRHSKPLTRAQQRSAEQRIGEERKWKEELFVKLPKSSFENLTLIARTRSAGLLTQLLNPDYQRLPPDHPYRRGFSSGVLQPLRPFTPLAPTSHNPQQHHPQQQPLSACPQPPAPVPAVGLVEHPPQATAVPAAKPDRQTSQHTRQASRTYQLPKRLADVGAMAKTPVATAVMSELRVGSVGGTKQVTTGGVSVNSNGGKYKSKPRPPETVMESDSETDDNQLDLSKSVAQEKLKALLQAKKLKKSAQVAQQDQIGAGVVGENSAGRQQQQIPSQSVEPISIPPPRLHYPYNLPPPNPPTTPRTTRRKMLAVEIPESLRRNLLWERQVSQAHARGLKRSASTNDAVKGWEIPNVVKLTPKNARQDEANDKKAESRRRYLARTRSWLFEYHVTGW